MSEPFCCHAHGWHSNCAACPTCVAILAEPVAILAEPGNSTEGNITAAEHERRARDRKRDRLRAASYVLARLAFDPSVREQRECYASIADVAVRYADALLERLDR